MSLSEAIQTSKRLLRHPTVLALLTISGLTGLIYWQTWQSLIDIWIRSETFAHGFIVIPVSLWLVWQNKAIHPYLYPGKPSWLGLIFLLANGFLWLLGSLIHALVIQQYALVGILIGSIWFYLGNAATKKLIFPLVFLYFMVPVGEALLPYLMQYTADFTVYLLRKTGLSVYREGMHFSLVTGDWSVVEACSGLRYLLASFTLGTIYAYITYRKIYKRVLFMLFSLILPIIANGLRAYMIVMIGHLSGMKLAVGVDHLVYGAVFFAIIIFFMFWIGSFFRDPPLPETGNTSTKITTNKAGFQKAHLQAMLILILGLSFWPFSNHWLNSHYHAQTSLPAWTPLSKNTQWQEIQAPTTWTWRPKFDGAANESLKYYSNGKTIVGVYQANFGDEKQGAELVSSKNVLRRMNKNPQLNERRIWHILTQLRTTLFPDKKLSIPCTITVLRHNRENKGYIVVRWYQIGETFTANDYYAKGLQLIKRLTLTNMPESYNVIFFKPEKSNIIDTQELIQTTKDNLFH